LLELVQRDRLPEAGKLRFDRVTAEVKDPAHRGPSGMIYRDGLRLISTVDPTRRTISVADREATINVLPPLGTQQPRLTDKEVDDVSSGVRSLLQQSMGAAGGAAAAPNSSRQFHVLESSKGGQSRIAEIKIESGRGTVTLDQGDNKRIEVPITVQGGNVPNVRAVRLSAEKSAATGGGSK
jgi:hypothetical protein